MKFFKPPFTPANIEKQYLHLRKAFEVSPGVYAPGVDALEIEREVCLRLSKLLTEVEPRKRKVYKLVPQKKTRPIVKTTQIIVEPDKIIDLVYGLANLIKQMKK
jgi:hypothetical protein